jgi:phosphoribosylformylglycinamidine (FGAM) synthase-like amidotransferase family enzyme
MKTIIMGAMLAAGSAAAMAQDAPAETRWGFYEPEGGTMQAGVVAADGAQMILKCDKPGKRSVYAVIATNTNLARALPDDRFESFPVTVRLDEESPWEDNWRFNDKFAMAVDKGNTRSLTRLLEKLHKADKIELRFKPNNGKQTIVEFETTGAQDAIERVYASCKDEIPYG